MKRVRGGCSGSSVSFQATWGLVTTKGKGKKEGRPMQYKEKQNEDVDKC